MDFSSDLIAVGTQHKSYDRLDSFGHLKQELL